MLSVVTTLLLAAGVGASEWPAFRGDGSAWSVDASPPIEWGIEEGKNVAWTVDLPGRGVSGPIVVAGRVFVTASDGPQRERLHTLCFDASTGQRLWSRRLWATGRTNCHDTSAVAAPTPASDGQRVFVFYSSNDLAAFTLNGDLLWVRGLALDHPGVGNDIGMASSPAVVGDAVVVQAECQNESFAISVDRRTGETLWQIDRPKTANWASPLPWTTDSGEAAVWLQGADGASLHDARTGERIARIDAECGTIPSPARGDNATLVLASGGVSLFAAPFDEPLQQIAKLKPGSTSPVACQGKLLVVNRGGVLTCSDSASGEMLWRRRLGGTFWATPTVADGRVYCINSKGDASVVDFESGEVLSKASFGEGVLASPAVAGDAVYFRSNAHLWKIAVTRSAGHTPHGPERVAK